jgi:hypothetical protein
VQAPGEAIYLAPIIQMGSMITGRWRHLGVHVFEGKITLDDMTRLEVAGTQWHKENPGNVVELVIIFPSDAQMSSDERNRMSKLIKRWESVRTASATVVLATGLLGSMHRSILTGMQMISPPKHPVKVFGAIEDAVAWLEPHVRSVCGPEVTRSALLGAVEKLCTTFRAARPAT